MKSGSLSRRSLLRTICTGLALPLLPGVSRAATAGAYPRRLVIFFVPEGVEPSAWWPTGVRSPTDYTMGPSMVPLEPFKDKLTLLRGFCHNTGFHGDAVEDMLTGGLAGPPLSVAGKSFASGVTIDQAVAAFIAGSSKYKSYQLGVRAFSDNLQRSTEVSFESGSNRRSAQNNPAQVFADLLTFVSAQGGPSNEQSMAVETARLKARKSLLDDVGPELARLRCRLGGEAREALEVHEAAVRTIETQIEKALAPPPAPAAGLTLPTLDSKFADRSVFSAVDAYPAVGKLQMDILATALAADTTRVATIQWSKSVARNPHPWLPLNYKNSSWHELSHAGQSGLDGVKAAADRAQIYTWYAEQFAHLLGRLAAVREGDGTLLDNTLVLYCSEMAEGNHGSNNIPYMLAGSAGGAFKTGQFLDARKDGAYRYQNDLLIAIGRGFGIPLERFGFAGRSGNKRYSAGSFDAILAA